MPDVPAACQALAAEIDDLNQRLADARQDQQDAEDEGGKAAASVRVNGLVNLLFQRQAELEECIRRQSLPPPPPPLAATFSGTGTLSIEHSYAHNPYTANVTIPLEFGPLLPSMPDPPPGTGVPHVGARRQFKILQSITLTSAPYQTPLGENVTTLRAIPATKQLPSSPYITSDGEYLAEIGLLGGGYTASPVDPPGSMEVFEMRLEFDHSIDLGKDFFDVDSWVSAYLRTTRTLPYGYPQLPPAFTATGTPMDASGAVKLVAAGRLVGGILNHRAYLLTVSGIVTPHP